MKKVTLLVIFLCLSIFGACEASDVLKSPSLEKVGQYTKSEYRGTDMIFSQDDKRLFIARNMGIEVLDLSDLSKPSLLTKITWAKETDNYAYNFAISSDDNYLFVTSVKALLVYDISNLDDIKMVNKVTVYAAYSLALSPDKKYLYLSARPKDRLSAIEVYNIEDVTNISQVGTYEHYGFDLKISPNGKILFYAIGSHDGKFLGLADISNPEKPHFLDEVATHFNNRMTPFTSAGFEQALFSTDSKKLYIAGNQAGLMVYDISKSRLNNIQITAGRHWSMMFNSTEGVYSLALDRTKNKLYLAGVVEGKKKHQRLEGATEDVRSIKGVDSTVLIQGHDIALSNKGDFLVVDYYSGMGFYRIN